MSDIEPRPQRYWSTEQQRWIYDEARGEDIELPALPPDSELHRIALEVEEGYGMGGLTDCLYEEFAADVARRYARTAVLMERAKERERCAKIADDMDYGMGELAAAIRNQGKRGAKLQRLLDETPDGV